MATRLPVEQVMTRSVLTIGADQSVGELKNFLLEHGISGAPVVDASGKVVGVISATDLLREGDTAEASAPRDAELRLAAPIDRSLSRDELRSMYVERNGDQTVRDLMTPVVFQVEEGASLDEVADLMVRGRIHRVLVVKHGKPTGIVTALDLVGALRDVLRSQPG